MMYWPTIGKEISERIRKVPSYYFIVGIILILGTFFRIYEFRDFLVFNPDQARDAQIIENVLSGKQDIPLLGPQSGNTKFSLGPIFYYFGIFSGVIFGARPEVFAYPDVLFSILFIPLFFFFLRKYFSLRISLLLVSLLATSYFALRYGRFAWNTNSIPFFSVLFLYGALEMMNEKNKNVLKWPIFVGIGLGVLIQLHTVLLFTIPLLSAFVFFVLLKKKSITLKSFLIILFLVIFINSGQIVSEIQTGGANISALFGGVSDQSGSGSNLVRNTLFISACQIQSNAHILSSFLITEQCGRGSFFAESDFMTKEHLRQQFFADGSAVMMVCLSILFFLLGYIFLFRGIQKEKEEERRYFLLLIALYNILIFLIFIPVASEITMRYFILLFIVPFILLGLLLQYVEEKILYGHTISFLCLIVLVSMNMYTNISMTSLLISKTANNANTAILGETEIIANFISSLERKSKNIYMMGNYEYEKRYHKPLQYILEKRGVNLVEIRNKTRIHSDETVVYITGKNKKQLTIGDEINDALILSKHTFNDVIIYVLREL